MASGSKIVITNMRQVLKHLEDLDVMNPRIRAKVRKAMREPFAEMKKDSRKNLKTQGSIMDGNLYRGLSVGSKFSKSKGYISIAFGGRASKNTRKGSQATHFHLVNSGTRRRKHKSGKSVGAVGQGRTKAANMNPSFKIGFADRAIKSQITHIYTRLVNDLVVVIKSVKTPGT